VRAGSQAVSRSWTNNWMQFEITLQERNHINQFSNLHQINSRNPVLRSLQLMSTVNVSNGAFRTQNHTVQGKILFSIYIFLCVRSVRNTTTRQEHLKSILTELKKIYTNRTDKHTPNGTRHFRKNLWYSFSLIRSSSTDQQEKTSQRGKLLIGEM
jgi:hypothetical protein